ncbi:MAG: EAL domain-containing protein [Sterolibacterium sp.]|jgi:diguanylate cyclase (GGDEF)-like protein/PAS domain S-box-containing protein
MADKVALLLVDDHPENLVALEAVLENPEIELVKATSGNAALSYTLKQDFALVLLDVQMPDMDGFETAELMRSNPKTRHLPIIFVTAGMKDIQLQFKGYELGAVDYLIKPFEPHILQSKVRVFCELYRQRRQLEANQLQLESKIRERVSQLRESEERFRMLATHAPMGIYQIDAEGRCVFVNRRWSEMSGLSSAEASGRGWMRTIHPADRDAITAIWSDATASRNEWSLEYRFLRSDGSVVWANGNAVALCDQHGRVSGYLGNTLDITARKQAEESMRLASLVYENSSEAMMVADAEGSIITVNPSFTVLTGYSADEVIGQNPRILKSGRHDDAFYRDMWQAINTGGHWRGEIWNRRKDGEIFAELLTINTIANPDGSPYRHVALFYDITQKKQSDELIWQQANFDALTGLPNRRMFLDRLGQEIKKSDRAGLPLALILLDFDHFKDVNDTLGHDMGDILLKDATRRMISCVRETDTIARLGGDEFTVILGAVDDPSSIERVAQDILQKLSEPFHLGSDLAYISASIGITLYPTDASGIEGLLKNADQAMYATKEQGRNHISYFTPSMQEAAHARMRLTGDLRGALLADQFRVYYQPIVELASGSIHKAEALIRWEHPQRGLVGPIEFIPIAENTGMIVEIGNWVFRQAAGQAARWRATHHAAFQVTINKSPVQFHNLDDSRDAWREHMRELGLSGQSIVVEITERLLLDTSTAVTDKLLEFRDLGIQVSLDDFGTGYSSLSYLQQFDIDYLKIDQSFVRDLAPGTKNMALCEAIIAMAHKLGMKVIAEGVETIEQSQLLTAAGCDYAQGYLYSRPVPPEEFDALLDSRKRK